MEERIRFVTHKNRKVLLVDLSNCTPDEVGQLCRLVPSYVTAEPRGSLLLLADFSGAKFDKAAVASRLGAKPRQLNPEIPKCRAGQQSRSPPQSFSAPPSRHRPRPCIAAPAMPIRRPIIRGAPSPPVGRVAPSPPAIARRPAAHLAAPLVCRPVLRASQGTTPGDERGWMG